MTVARCITLHLLDATRFILMYPTCVCVHNDKLLKQALACKHGLVTQTPSFGSSD